MFGTVGFLFNRLFGGPWGLGQFSRPNIWESRPSKCALPYERSDVAWVGGWLIRKSFQPHLYGISLLSMVGRQSSISHQQPPATASHTPRAPASHQSSTRANSWPHRIGPGPVRPSSCPLRARRWVDAHPLATTNRSHGSQLSPNVMSPKEARSGGDHRWGGARRWERERERVRVGFKMAGGPGGGGILAAAGFWPLALSPRSPCPRCCCLARTVCSSCGNPTGDKAGLPHAGPCGLFHCFITILCQLTIQA